MASTFEKGESGTPYSSSPSCHGLTLFFSTSLGSENTTLWTHFVWIWILLFYVQGFPGGSESKESVWSTGDPGSDMGLWRSPRKGNDYPIQYSGEFRGERSLVDYSPQGCKESDTTEQLTLSHFCYVQPISK